MKTYNEILVERLRNMPGNRYQAPLDAADVIEEQDIAIARKQKLLDEAVELAQDISELAKLTASRMVAFEKALWYIHNNPCAHPEHVKWVVKDALGVKD